MGFKRFETVALIMIYVTFGAKLLKIPGAIQVFIISFGVLGLSYLLAGWYLFSVKEEGIKQNNIAFSIFAGFSLYSLLFGAAFKVCSWPGYYGLILIGFPSAVFLLCLSFIFRERNTLKLYYSLMIKRLAIILCFCIIILPIPAKHYSYTKEGIRTQEIKNPDGTKTEVIDTGQIH